MARSKRALSLMALLTLFAFSANPTFAQNEDNPLPPTGDGTDATSEETSSEAESRPHRMEEGKIPVIHLMRFIQATSGKLVNYPSASRDPAFAEDAVVEVLGDVEPLTFPIVQAILETNGYELWESTLDDGTVVINVRSSQARTNPPLDPVSPIIEPGDDPPRDEDEELATLVLQLQFVEVGVVRQALGELLDLQGTGRTTGSLKVVTVQNNDTLIIRAKLRVLEHIQDLVRYIDVEVVGPESVIQIRELFYADADQLVGTISEALNLTGSFGDRTTSGRTTPTRGTSGRTPRQSTGLAAGLLGSQATRLIADARTQKIIIQSSDEAELDLVHQLIDELDTRVRNHRTNTHIYKVKFLKAEELADDLRQLIEGGGGSVRNTGRTSSRTTTRGGVGNTAQQQQQSVVTRIVPHEQTNSLMIQGEPEEYEEIARVLEQIDQRRRQVFLEVALVQVSDSSNLNLAIELLAGNLDDEATRVAAASGFGLSTIDPTQLPDNFTRAFGAALPATGLIGAVSSAGQLPVILRAIKTDKDSQILATPFILADDNQVNSISVQTEIFFQTSNTTNVNTTSGQSSESAGINLSLTPTISQEVVLLELELEVSSFAGVTTTAGTLPDRATNSITSKVTIPDGGLFVIGGLARENENKTVDKVPLLGDLPILGKLFQSRGSNWGRDNLYVFLSAHILDEEDFNILQDISDQAIEGVRSFTDHLELQQFNTEPRVEVGSEDANSSEKE